MSWLPLSPNRKATNDKAVDALGEEISALKKEISQLMCQNHKLKSYQCCRLGCPGELKQIKMAMAPFEDRGPIQEVTVNVWQDKCLKCEHLKRGDK